MEDFVSYELAKRLKDLGYNTSFFFFYRTDDKLIHHAMVSNPLTYGKYTDDEVVIAPTIHQVLKWLREEKKIYISVLYHEYYAVWIQPMKHNEAEHVIHDCKTHEEASMAGIEYVLDNLI